MPDPFALLSAIEAFTKNPDHSNAEEAVRLLNEVVDARVAAALKDYDQKRADAIKRPKRTTGFS